MLQEEKKAMNIEKKSMNIRLACAILGMCGSLQAKPQGLGISIEKILPQPSGELVISAKLVNSSRTPIKLDYWTDPASGCNFDLVLSESNKSKSAARDVTRFTGVYRSIVPITSRSLSPGEVVHLSGRFNPKRKAGEYDVSIALTGSKTCISASTRLNLSGSNGGSK